MFDTSNAFAVRGTTIPPLLWDTFQEAVARDMAERTRKEGHMPRLPKTDPDKLPPVPYKEAKEAILARRLKYANANMALRQKRYKAILAAMTNDHMTALEIADNMGGNANARTVAESMRYLTNHGQVQISSNGKNRPHRYTRIK